MKKTNLIQTLVLLLIPVIVGCKGPRYAGAPPPAFNVDKDIQQLDSAFKQSSSIASFYDPTNHQNKLQRDRFITGRLVLINLNYVKWMRTITADKQLLDTASDILVMSLNLAGAAVGSSEAKTVLAAVAAGVGGSKTTVDKYYFYEKTVPALASAMNAQRKMVLTNILTGMASDLKGYPFEQAVTDLNDYYQAGTFMGAINTIQADSGAKEKAADEGVKHARVKLAEIASDEQMDKETTLHNVWNELNDQINTGAKTIADADQKIKLRGALQKVLGPAQKLPDDDAGLVKQLHRFLQTQRERAGELLTALNEANYKIPAK